jgi:3-hydroxypropanoate dehydrogenase
MTVMPVGNAGRSIAARVAAITGHALTAYDCRPKLFAHMDARAWFSGNKDFAVTSAFPIGTLQGGYFILAARALGFCCRPF